MEIAADQVGKFSEQARKLIDGERISLTNAMELANVPIPEQDLFLYEAEHFTLRSLKAAIRHWNGCSKEKQEVLCGVIDAINDAFDEWERWQRNNAESDQEEAGILRARGRVLAYLHGLRPPPEGKVV